MATNKIFSSLESAGKKSRLDGFSLKSYATEVALLADTYDAVLHDGRSSFAVCFAENTGNIWYFKGSKTNTDASSAGFNTSWFSSADKDEEIILALANPPINTDVLGTIVTGVAPVNLTANTKLVTYQDVNGDVHLYQVIDPLGTPIFKQISEPKFVTLVTTETTVSGLTGSSPRFNTLFKNATTGQIFLVTQDGLVTEISRGDIDYYGVFVTTSLVAGVETIYDINADATLATSNLSSTLTETAFSKYLIDLQLFDVSNNEQLATASYAVRPITTSTFGVTSNVNVDVITSFNFVGK